ncbi:MAG: UvrD-helicase domain-containing protein [Alphaproteobacteria bacterium]|nr:UvrD-helicase domain-containing protein [Alphaproteobacteria bacterium]
MLKLDNFSKEQNDAANPLNNVWVQANAGTGKTAVLVRRLLRILFRNRLKSHKKNYGILCLTYTNAAACEMKNRVLKALSQWASLSDSELKLLLSEAISDQEITAEDIQYARKVFFFYIDNSEMLKIKTIHGFCEEILRKFPVEAGINSTWSLVSDSAQRLLLQETLNRMIFKSYKKDELHQDIMNAFSKIVETSSEHYLDRLLQILTGQYKQFFQISDIQQYKNYFVKQLKTTLHLVNDIHIDKDINKLKTIINFANEDILNSKKTAPKYLENIINATKQYIDNTIDFSVYKNAYLTADNEPIINVSKKEYCIEEQNRVFTIQQNLLNTQIFDNTMALFDLSLCFANTYKEIKQEQNVLDYDDLILYTQHLFSKPDVMGWVLKQLDTRLDHILVDEAQDTSPQQWDIIKMIAGDFFTDGTDYINNRSMFVVGDIKQSIYGFQGADPSAFVFSKEEIENNINNNSYKINTVSLNFNYRSTKAILNTVDYFFKNITCVNNEYYKNIQHKCSRLQDDGLVEMYPLLSNEKEYTSRIKQYSYDIATKIKQLINEEGYQAKDIMVLVQNRKPFVVPLTSELKRMNVPIAGNDRITLPDYPVIKDMLNIIRFCINPADDYMLCCILKSPFYRLKERDVFELCNIKNQTQNNETILEILSVKYNHIYKDIIETLEKYKKLNAFSFYNYILNKNNNRKSIISALGKQIIDPLEEFLNICLNYERSQSGTLKQFIKWFVLGDNEIKRDMNSSDGVRIMTVHGSKGLDSKVVFLIDTVSTPKQTPIATLNIQKSSYYKTWVWLENQPKTHAIDKIKQSAQTMLYEEYYRLLYVAMTRARDRLYIYGCETNPIQENSWYTQLQKTFTNYKTSSNNDSKIVITNDTTFYKTA